MTDTAATLDLPFTPPPGGQILHASDRATIIWGDCRDPQVIAQVPMHYGLLCTDPPYGMAYRSNWGKNFTQIEGDDGSVDWPGVLAEWVGPAGTKMRGLAEKRHVYVFGYRAADLAEPLRLSGTADLVWDKMMTGMGHLESAWGPAHEPIAFGVHVMSKANRDAGSGRLAARLRKGSVLRYPRPNSTGVRRHSNEKPVPLLADLIESSTTRAHRIEDCDLVVDPCAGSGSTGVAAILEGRRCFLVEIDRANAEECVRRIKAAEKIAALIDAA